MNHYSAAKGAPRTTKDRREWRLACKEWPDRMTLVQIPQSTRTLPSGTYAVKAWRSSRYLATHWRERNGNERLSVNRVDINTATGAWKEGITWEQLQEIKSQCGFDDKAMIEIYPPGNRVINDAPMRHLWFVDEIPKQTW